jgi:hypothetical protein
MPRASRLEGFLDYLLDRRELADIPSDESHCLGDGRLVPILLGCSHVISNGRGITLPGRQEQIALQTMLLGVQLEVTSAQRIEFFVSAAFDNLSLLDDQNLIGAPNGRQAIVEDAQSGRDSKLGRIARGSPNSSPLPPSDRVLRPDQVAEGQKRPVK